MKKSLAIIVMSCVLFGNQYPSSESGLQPTDTVQSNSGSGLGDVGPPHDRDNDDKIKG